MLDDPISEGKRFGFWYCAGFIEHLDDFCQTWQPWLISITIRLYTFEHCATALTL